MLLSVFWNDCPLTLFMQPSFPE